ncbi:hypothetical protein GIB67_036191 [Kingdonia uniflora]|uniref:GRAM domain-containing protein n=1 Tax=Kingdonia uniflora TaxID=39325 RepID=A0A7J7M9T1_9MAGN|nr:hypothetical protein GIB67_036191 [Kingdonia uniflora]
MARIAQSTKVLAEGGYEKIFHQSFETTPEEKLEKSYACYLSTSAGPVIIPLHQLKAVNPSTSKTNPAEKYIQVISVDSHEFWFIGFVNYDSAVAVLQEALQSPV